jgi:hypothetical protein
MRAALEPRILILCPLAREWSFLVSAFEASLYVERLHDLKIEAAYIPDWRALVAPGGHGKTQFAVQAQYLIGQFPSVELVMRLDYIAKSLTPIPFKIMAIAAGVAAMSPSAFLASAVVGRALHFAIVASLIALWGDRVMALVSGYGRMLAVFSVLLLLGIAVAYHLP